MIARWVTEVREVTDHRVLRSELGHLGGDGGDGDQQASETELIGLQHARIKHHHVHETQRDADVRQ